MKIIFLAVLAVLASASANAADFKVNGSATVRQMWLDQDDGLGSVNGANQNTSIAHNRRVQFRANLTLSEKSENLDSGIGVRTFNGPASEFLFLQDDLDRFIGLELAFFRPHLNLAGHELSVTVGRQKTVILYDTAAQTFLDRDVRWDGLGWKWSKGAFSFATTQYLLGARQNGFFQDSAYAKKEYDSASTGGFGYLFSFQPSLKLKLADELEATLAVGYHVWSNVDAPSGQGFFTNRIHGSYGPSDAAPTLVTITSPRQLQIFTEWRLPYKLTFTGEYTRNKKVYYGNPTAPTGVEADRDSLGLTLSYGVVKKRHDFGLDYTYVSRGIATGFAAYSWSELPIDNKGHVIAEKYALVDNLVLVAREYFFAERSGLDGNGQTPANPNRHTSAQRFELTAALDF